MLVLFLLGAYIFIYTSLKCTFTHEKRTKLHIQKSRPTTHYKISRANRAWNERAPLLTAFLRTDGDFCHQGWDGHRNCPNKILETY
jgi:hypothetical protein